MKKLRFVGLDVHKESIAIAVADVGSGPAESHTTIRNDDLALLRLLDQLGRRERLRICYEAGATGFRLARMLRSRGYDCVVVAPSLIPKRAGERIKTDRRDAAKLARYLRGCELTEVSIPEEQTEAMRDLERAREDAVHALGSVRHRLDKFLLRHGRPYPPRIKKWGERHRAWLMGQSFSEEAQRRTLAAYIRQVDQATSEVNQLTKDMEELVEAWALAPLVKNLQALRGVRLVTAATLAAEIGNFRRFARPRQLMAYLGLVPSEHSSGESRRRGGITRTGNRQVRRVLVEAAWSYRHPVKVSKEMKARQEGLGEEVKRIALSAQRRLHGRYQSLQHKGKPLPKVVTALARELAGFVWAIAQTTQAPAKPPQSGKSAKGSGNAKGAGSKPSRNPDSPPALRRQGRPALASSRMRPQGPAGLAGEGRTATAKPAAGLGRKPVRK